MRITQIFLVLMVGIIAMGCGPTAPASGGPDTVIYAGPQTWTTNGTLVANDLDGDGIPDDKEVEGENYFGLDVYGMGALPNQYDVFVEVDYMQSNNDGLTPRAEALEMVRLKFLEHDIYIHFDVGSLYSQFDLGGGGQVPYANRVSLGGSLPVGFKNARNDYRNVYMDTIRRRLFYYILFGSKQADSNDGVLLGIGELANSVSLITLELANLSSSGPPALLNQLINVQASTLMHELGHNLNLNHGGGPSDGDNFKPNYISTMNYLYTFPGIPTLGFGEEEGERYYLGNADTCGSTHPVTLGNIDSPISSSQFKIDFSDGSRDPIDETDVYESLGLGTGNSAPVDFNCNGDDTDDNYAINLSDITSLSVLEDHDDWGNLFFGFQFVENQEAATSALVGTIAVIAEPAVYLNQ